jgi:hypothetical protein
MKSVVYSLIALTIVATALASAPAFAQQSSPMTDEHIARIKANCQSALVTLGQIRTNEAPVFINRNQTYFSISDKLMARLNSRLTLNRYDATQLVKTASEYNTALAKFRTVYKQYDDTMAELIRMDCKRQPVGFYDKVAIVRQQRQKVHDTAEQLKNLIDQYRQGVDTFRTQHLSQLTGASHE